VGFRIGELLVQRGVSTQAAVEAAVRDANARRVPLLSYLLAAGVDEGALAAVLAERHRLPGVDLSRSTIGLEAVRLVPRPVAEADQLLPLSLEGGRLHLAMARPVDERIISEVRFVTGLEVSPYAAVKAALERAVGAAYDAHARGEACWRGGRGPDRPLLAVAMPPAPDSEEAVEVPDDAILGEEEVPIEVEPPGSALPRADGRPLVLVVDDEPEIRRLVQRTLEGKGYAVETASDGAEALSRADALIPDVILLDAMLPKVHGFEACRRLKSSQRTWGVPVIMMTAIYRGWRFAHDAQENFGAEDYLEKPFRLDDLLRRVEAAREASALRPKLEVSPAAALVGKGRELLAAGDTGGAAEVLAEAVRADPYAAEAHYQLGRALRAAGDAFGAMTALERAAELRPQHLSALRTLAALYEEKGFRRKAAEMLEHAMAAGPAEAREGLRQDLLRLLA
jgi:DNA-binding response OmpR family regulator